MLAEEEKGYKAGATGRKDEVTLQPAHTKQLNQYVAYIQNKNSG
jgi:hypothetical protein